MTRKLYYENNYIKCFKAVVTGCEKLEGLYGVILDATHFYPEGGGQPADTGRIGEARVFDVRERNGVITHYTDRVVTAGCEVECEIDWARRFEFMQQHSGEHIVSGVINGRFGYDNVGFHMGSENITIDINGLLSEDNLDEIEEAANRAIYENIPIAAAYPSEDKLKELKYRSKKSLSGEVRIVSIEGYDNCACCGLHTARTGEIGLIKLLSAQKYKGGTRIYMLCGEKAMRDYNTKNKSVYEISASMSAKPYEVAEAVRFLLDENSALKQQINEYIMELFIRKAAEIPLNTEKVYVFEDDLSPSNIRRFCTLLCERAGLVLVFSGKDDEYKYAVGSHTLDVRDFGKILNSRFNGKGGGQRELIQGTVYANKEAIEDMLKREIFI